ncbi:MAG: universal stress protein [Ignavibacteriae bacterium]|jgi:nucleotide-binding universal stress UspA family protein|nr:universal stress protein [Ignavibacteriota bacterium]NOH00069.1 universal stress protein [Ignavibacteriota bacterium]
MKKRFIILIDFSEYSKNLLKYAYDWSKQVNAELLLVHQTTVMAPALIDSEIRKAITQHANEEAFIKLQKLAKEVLPPNVKVSYSVSENLLEFTLQKYLAEFFDHIIFVGLKGTGLLKQIFIGSVAVEVINKTKNIIVAMPKEIYKFSHEKIFVAVTEKHPLNISEFKNFLNFVDGGKTSITFFNLYKPSEKNENIQKQLEELSEMFANRFNTSIAVYRGDSSFVDIKKVINNKIDEILVVQKGSRHLTDQLFRKFFINELVFEGQTPLVVLP